MPDTLNYMITGYGIAFLILGLTVLSLWWRFRNLAQDEVAIAKIEREITMPATSDQAMPQPAR